MHQSVTAINERLESAGAIVLERVARGGGATNWYCCDSRSSLTTLESLLLPGSVVTFYFDGRFRADEYSTKVRSALRQVIVDTARC